MATSSFPSVASMSEGLPLRQHQVFINFRGAELRNNFISHLETALKNDDINYYTDRNEVPGQSIEIISHRIDESDIALVVFSKRYSESKWCLYELERIMKNVAEKKQKVIPIFYDVTFDDVIYQQGEFGMHFYTSHKERTKMVEWEKALKSAPNKLALMLANFRSESDFIAKIVASVKDVIAIIERGEGTNTLSRNISSLSSRGNAFSRDIREPKSSSTDAKTNADFLDRNCTNSPMDSKVKPPNIQVFINFRGGELCNNFVSRLVHALWRSEINVFIDNREQSGEDLNTCFKRIEGSGIAIVVFSSRYTESKWCLEELVKIKERAHKGLLKVLPIFYKVTPTNVGRFRGEFGDNFRDKEYMSASDEPNIKQWRKAIVSVSDKFGLTFDEKSDNEADFVDSIVKQVKIVITQISPKLIKTDRDPMEAEIFQPEAKSRRDDGLNLTKDDNFLGETNSSSTVVKLPPNHQMLRYGFLIHLVKVLKSYKITIQLGMIIGCLLPLFFCLQHIAYVSTPSTGEGGAIHRIVENVPKVLEFIPAERTEIPRDKFTEFSTNPENLCKEICSNSPMDGKVKPPNIQVFINFRGEQLRNNFVGYLVDALRRSEINVFIDNHEQRGEDLNTLFKRIEGSGIAIVVFSSRYTESKWCLEELVKIKERVHQGLLKVLPIFYKVTPGNVKRLKGEFGDNFRDKEYMYASDEPKIKRWKEAIVFVSHKFALTFDEKSSVLEIDFIETIVKEVLKMLQAISTVESGQSSR